MTDDQTFEQQRLLTRTNALIGAAGTTFTNAVVSYSECCPSRTTFLTGRYSHNHGVLSSALPTGGASKFPEGRSLSTWLQDAGYHTALVGKYLNGYGVDVPAAHVPPGWSEWFGLIDPAGYNFYDYDVSDNGTVVHFGHQAADYSTDVLFERAERLVRDRVHARRPLFLVITPTAPHVAAPGLVPVPAPRHGDRFGSERAPRTPAFNLPDASTLPPWIASSPLLSEHTIANLDEMYRITVRSLLAVDEGVERIHDALRDTGALDDTLFVFTSDNGFHFGDHRIPMGKSDPFEQSIRVPLLVRAPGFPAGAVVRQPVANIDLAPTILAAAGVRPPIAPDGVPLTGFVADPAYGAHRTVVIENGPYAGRRTFVGVRDDRWSYVEHSTGDIELYDLVADPHETRNLAGDASAASARSSRAALLDELRSCAGTSCRAGLPR